MPTRRRATWREKKKEREKQGAHSARKVGKKGRNEVIRKKYNRGCCVEESSAPSLHAWGLGEREIVRNKNIAAEKKRSHAERDI